MTSLERPAAHKVLLVDDDDVREMMTANILFSKERFSA